MGVRLLHDVRDLPEDTNDVLPSVERDRAHLHCHALAVGVDHHHRRVRHGGRADHLAREELTGTAGILGGDDRGELASPTSPTIARAAGFTQRMTPVVSMR